MTDKTFFLMQINDLEEKLKKRIKDAKVKVDKTEAKFHRMLDLIQEITEVMRLLKRKRERVYKPKRDEAHALFSEAKKELEILKKQQKEQK